MPSNLQYAFPNSQTIQRTVLDNGIVVLVYPNPHVQSVVVYGSFYGGAVFEPITQSGIASFTASMLMKGTRRYDFDAIHGSLERIGADFNIGSGTFTVSWSSKALAEDLPVLINTMQTALREPVFPVEHFEILRQQRLTDMAYRAQDTRYQAGRAFREALYDDTHPYHYSIAGTPDTINTLTVENLQEFYQRHYGANTMLVTIVGNIDAQKATALVADALGDWRNEQLPSLPAIPTTQQPQAHQHVMTPIVGKTQSDVVLGRVGPARRDERYRASSLANSVLGEFGMMGRIGHAVREQSGLAYYAYSTMEGGLAPGMWSVVMGVSPQDVEEAIDKARAEIRRIATEPISAQDLADNKSYFNGRLPLRLASNSGLATIIMMMERYELGLDYLLTYADEINALTVDDVLEATRTYLDADALVISVAGPE